MTDLPVEYILHIAGVTLPLREVSGREAISETSRFTVRAFVPKGAEIDPDAVIKSSAAITLERAGVIRRIDAIVSEVFVSHSVSGEPELSALLEPRFALGRHRTNMKIFRNKHALDIVSEVLGELGVTFALRVAAVPPVRPYAVQFRESDFHFVSRMLEEEGLFYFFAEGDVMVIGNSAGAYDAAGPLPFRRASGMDRNDEAIWAMGEKAQVSVSQVSLRDWTLDAPSQPMDVQAQGPTPIGPEFYDYPGEYEKIGEGQRLASLMADAFACQAEGVTGSAFAPIFGAGRTFSVLDAPARVPAGEHVLTAVDHDYDRTRGGFGVSFQALSTALPFRPPRLHEEPILPNPLTGVVTGPPGADIHCDELGRVKVHFFWDRLQPYDDSCSHWIPVMQDNTAHSVGIPRVGWEVLVHFLEGDPDRPVVLGRVYNGEDLLPVLLPEHKTKTQLGSLVSPSRNGFNLIELEDRAGHEKIWVMAEKDQNIKIANDRTERIVAGETSNVSRDETVEIGNDNTVQVGGRLNEWIENTQALSVAGDQQHAAAGAYHEEVFGNRTLNIAGAHKRRVAKDDVQLAHDYSEQVGAAILEASLGDNVMAGSIGLSVNVGGAVIEAAMGSKSETASVARAETVGGVVFTKAGKDIKHGAGKSRITTVGGALKINAKGNIGLSGVERFSAKSLKQAHVADTELSLSVGDSKLVMTDNLIQLYAPDIISVKCQADNQLAAVESYQNSGDSNDDAHNDAQSGAAE